MKIEMIVNRIDDWFEVEDLDLDFCSLSMKMLIRLSTRKKAGFTYDRIKLASDIIGRKSVESIEAIDNAIVILLSRNLIQFEEKKYGEKKVLITEDGLNAVGKFKELINNVD